VEQLQSHIWLTASSYVTKYLRISSYTVLESPSSYLTLQPLPWPISISLYMRTFFLSVWPPSLHYSSSPPPRLTSDKDLRLFNVHLICEVNTILTHLNPNLQTFKDPRNRFEGIDSDSLRNLAGRYDRVVVPPAGLQAT
jgi:hypothetical protein